MSMSKKHSKEEKIKILQESKKNGVKVTLEKYSLYPATFYYWKKKYESDGEQGLSHGFSKEKEKRFKDLEKENLTLRAIIADKELESKLKDELLKKKYPHLKNVH
jgi:putative transposase